MKKKLNELGENALNYLSATLFNPPEVGYMYGEVSYQTDQNLYHREYWRPCSRWHQAGQIIEQNKISIQLSYEGSTPLIALVRCYIASKLGDIVDVPEEYLDDY